MKPFPPTSNLSRGPAAAIAWLKRDLTAISPIPLRTDNLCNCGNTTESAKHLLLSCTETQATLTRAVLLYDQKGPTTLQSTTNKNIRQKELI